MEKKTRPKGDFHFTPVLERSDNKLWGCHFRVPLRIAKQLVGDGERRVVCTLNNATEYQCAMIPHGNGSLVITVNKKLRDTLGLSFGSEVNVTLRKDTSTYGLPLPEELQVLFQQDAEGRRLFHGLTRGRQRTLLYIIGSVKSTEKRIARAIAVIEHLKGNKGTINYKQLNRSIRDSRR
jgi:hypothetical protein